MELRELSDLTTELQSLCHEGHSKAPVLIRVLDGIYKVGAVNKMTVGNNEDDRRTCFVINALPINEKEL